MGMERIVHFSAGPAPSWPTITQQLTQLQPPFPVEMRMIDGQLAFPDEIPHDNWREIRVAVPGGMISLRRSTEAKTAQRVTCVIWGNADDQLRSSWNLLAWALAKLGDGTIELNEPKSMSVSSEQFAELVGLQGV